MRHLLALLLTGLPPLGALACPRCAPIVQAGVFNADFLVNLMLIVTPLVLVGLVAMVLHRLGERP